MHVREPSTTPPTTHVLGTLFREAVGFSWALQLMCAWAACAPAGHQAPLYLGGEKEPE